jgi:hypothetical protein
MPSIEERVARLEERDISKSEKLDVLFEKVDRLIDKISMFTDILSEIKQAHIICSKVRDDSNGWIKGRFTKVFDAGLAVVLAGVVIMLLKNAPTLLGMIGGGK